MLYTCCLQDQETHAARPQQIDTAEMLDEIITRSRGEIRHASSPKVTSSTPTSLDGLRTMSSPRVSHRAYSPRVNDLQGGRSPRNARQGVEMKQTPSPRPSPLGQDNHGTPKS